MAAFANPYEVDRDNRIARNKRKLEELGVFRAKTELEGLVAASRSVPARKTRAVKEAGLSQEMRRSGRERPTVNYCEDERTFRERVPGPKQRRSVVFVDREELDASMFSSPKIRSNHDSGKGVRIQGGRVYDSKLGVTCHWCRQKTVEDKVTCTAPKCGSGRRLPISFCRMCLYNRHGENVHEAEGSGRWVCPCCRVSCGKGCTSCCNCGPCRKKAGLAPTHQIIKEVRQAGFDNVHDYLVHQATGEAKEAIAGRKDNAVWKKVGPSPIEAPAKELDDTQNMQDQALTRPLQGKEETSATVDAPFTAIKANISARCDLEKTADKTSRRAARKMRALIATGLMAPLAA